MPVRYIPYIPETTDGQAILDNFTRTRRALHYRDNNRVFERIRRGLPLYEAEKIEQVGDNSENLLLRGECLSACAYLKDKGIKVDLVYIDPPFASGADYAKKIYLRKNPKIADELVEKEVALESGEEWVIEEYKVFEEKMYGDIWHKEEYLNWMYENLTAIYSIMSETGSIYVHLDWHIVHYVKILMDEIFGDDNFLNEIIWVYRERGISKSHYNRKHDTLLFYTKQVGNQVFNSMDILDKYSDVTLKKFKYVDITTGKRFRIRGRNVPEAGDLQRKTDIPIELESQYTYRQYLEDSEGSLPKDWFELPFINQAADERLNYSTQKPEALLERIIKGSSNEGMIVADFFGGSGVTAAVSHRLGRQFIGSDVGVNSLLTTRDRLKENGASFNILDIKDGVSLFRNPVQTMDKLKSLIKGLRNEDSLDAFWEGAIEDSKEGLIPVYVPNLLDHSAKLLDIVAMNRIMNDAMPDLPEDVSKVIVYYIDIEDPKAMAAFIADKNETNVEIELRDLKEVLDEIVLNDTVEYEIRETAEGFEIEFISFVSDRLQQKIDEYNQKRALQGVKKDLLEIAEEGDGEPPTKKAKFKPLEISDNGLELIELVSLDSTNKEGTWQSDTEIKIDKNSFLIRDGQKTKGFWDGKILSKKKPLRLKVRNIAGDESTIIF